MIGIPSGGNRGSRLGLGDQALFLSAVRTRHTVRHLPCLIVRRRGIARTGVKVLVVEDNADLAANIGDYLSECGHIVDFAADGPHGLQLATSEQFDALVLDLSLPGLDGLEVCARLRQSSHGDTPILMLTARDAVEHRLKGFAAGADDYLIKPFSLQELEARLNVIARRKLGPRRRLLEVGDLQLDLDSLTAVRAGKSIALNPIGLKILRKLMEASPAVVTREELERTVWGDELPDSDSLRVHIHGLRAAIDRPFVRQLLQTRHGIGYRLASE